MKVKLIEVLNMIEDKTLKDDERVIIDNDLYYFSQEEKKFYDAPSSKHQSNYRNIYTYNLDLECDLIDKNIIEVNAEKRKSTEEIEELEYAHNFYSLTKYDELKLEIDKIAYLLRGINESIDLSLKNKIKINELVREVNRLKRNE